MGIRSIKKALKGNKTIYTLYSLFFKNMVERRRIKHAKDELQNNGKYVIEKIEKSLDENEITYFVNFGSLLGIVRDGKFMSFDHDIDFGVIDNDLFDWEKLQSVIEKCGGIKTKQFRLDGQITEQSYRFGHLDVDFFRCIIKDNKAIQYLYYKDSGIMYSDELEYSVGEFCTPSINGVEKKEIGDVVFSIPQNSKEYLESIYSSNWMVPDPNWDHLKGPSMTLLTDKRGYAQFLI